MNVQQTITRLIELEMSQDVPTDLRRILRGDRLAIQAASQKWSHLRRSKVSPRYFRQPDVEAKAEREAEMAEIMGSIMTGIEEVRRYLPTWGYAL